MSAASLDTQIRRANWAQLNGLAGTLTDDDFAAADALSAQINQATDADIEARWGIQSPSLRQDIRALFDQSWSVAR